MADDVFNHQPLFLPESPLFDAGDLPSLRRVKPLPKRRRTTVNTQLKPSAQNESAASDDLNKDVQQTNVSSSYTPIFGAALEEMLRGDVDARHVDFAGDIDSYSDHRDDGDGYADHLIQPGNTKKRKVPLSMSSRQGDDIGSQEAEDDLSDRFLRFTGADDAVAFTFPPSSPVIGTPGRKWKTTRATMTAMRLKEQLRNRKRQLSTVLGAISEGDSPILDQALSSNYPFIRSVDGDKSNLPPVRLSQRPERRRAHMQLLIQRLAAETNREKGLPATLEGAFTFEHDSPTSERLRATREAVALLQARFEVELTRQAAKAAEAARQAALAVSQMQEAVTSRTQRKKSGNTGGIAQTTGTQKENQSPTTKSKGKKKKRSALANASNPHHLRNYVPSRLPHSGPNAWQTAVQNLLSPFPLRFLSAEIPPRRRRDTGGVTTPSITSLTPPEDEWICPFCEYSLFYGDDSSFRKAVRNRKKILSRRRRALERAAAAASGAKKSVTAATASAEDPVDEDDADAFDGTSQDGLIPGGNTGRGSMVDNGRGSQERDRDKGRDRPH